MVIVCIGSSVIYAYLASFWHEFDICDKDQYFTRMEELAENGLIGQFKTRSQFNSILFFNQVIELLFFIDMCMTFFVEYQEPDSHIPERNFHKIAFRYLNGQFIYDLIPLVPLNFFFCF